MSGLRLTVSGLMLTVSESRPDGVESEAVHFFQRIINDQIRGRIKSGLGEKCILLVLSIHVKRIFFDKKWLPLSKLCMEI